MIKKDEFLNQVRDRFANPLFLSFIFSWIVINWKITVALVWYDNVQIKNEGYISVYDFISKNLNSCDAIWVPLGMACAYTIGYPFVRSIIQAIQSLAFRFGEFLDYKVLKGSKIDMNKYLKLKEEYTSKAQKLHSLINEESENIEKIRELNDKNAQLQDSLNQSKMTLNNLNEKEVKSKNMSMLNGYWHNNFSGTGGRGKETVNILNHMYLVYSDEGYSQKYTLIHFQYDETNNRVFFIKQTSDADMRKDPSQPRYLINDLRFDGLDLVGTENGNDIRYVKKVD